MGTMWSAHIMVINCPLLTIKTLLPFSGLLRVVYKKPKAVYPVLYSIGNNFRTFVVRKVFTKFFVLFNVLPQSKNKALHFIENNLFLLLAKALFVQSLPAGLDEPQVKLIIQQIIAKSIWLKMS